MPDIPAVPYTLAPLLVLGFTQAAFFFASFAIGFFMAVGAIMGSVAGWRWVRGTRRNQYLVDARVYWPGIKAYWDSVHGAEHGPLDGPR